MSDFRKKYRRNVHRYLLTLVGRLFCGVDSISRKISIKNFHKNRSTEPQWHHFTGTVKVSWSPETLRFIRTCDFDVQFNYSQGWAKSLNGDRKLIRYNKIWFEISLLLIWYKVCEYQKNTVQKLIQRLFNMSVFWTWMVLEWRISNYDCL